MRISEAKLYLPFVQALAEGKMIQYRPLKCHDDVRHKEWIDWHEDRILFTEPSECYRIKPEPMAVWAIVNPGCPPDVSYWTEDEAKACCRHINSKVIKFIQADS